MNFELMRKLSEKPKLYERGSAVMWTDPHIAKQLLELHINPEHDVASRNRRKIELTVDWILSHFNKPGLEILDLGCGPGLYAELMAQKGNMVTGVDFSIHSIRYASRHAKEKQLSIDYLNQNYLDLDFVDRFDLVILIYVDFCVLLPDEREKVLRNIHRALRKGGLFIFDVINEKNIDTKVIPPSWEVRETGFWKDTPHIALSNGYHFPEAKVTANHHIVIGDDDKVDTYIFWHHYYSAKEITGILEANGFSDIKYDDHVLADDKECTSDGDITFYAAVKEY